MSRPARRIPTRPYHHGDLKAALLNEAEAILERDGVKALTLRAIARAAGVSHTAPRNHFGDLTGLLSELAAVGFGRFGVALETAMRQAGDDPRTRMKAMGRAYVVFARTHPGMFVLMFRSEQLDGSRPALRAAIDAARRGLRDATTEKTADKPLTPLQLSAQATAAWSLVHGFAVLLLDGRLDGLLKSLPGKRRVDTLLDAVLATSRVDD